MTVAPGAAVVHGGCSRPRGAIRRGRAAAPSAPARPLVVLPLIASALNRYARASGITPAAFVGFSPFPSPPPPLAQLASWPGRKSLRARAPVSLRPPSGLGLPGTPGQASAGGPSGRLPPSHFLVSVAVGSSGATPPPPPRRPVSPAAIKAEWGGLRQRSRAPSGRAGALPPRPPFWGPGAGLFLLPCGGFVAAAGIDIVAVASHGHYMLWCVICNTSQYRRPGT